MQGVYVLASEQDYGLTRIKGELQAIQDNSTNDDTSIDL